MQIKLKPIFATTFRLGVLAAVFGPAALGLTQCSSQNDYDAWDKRAIDSYAQNTQGNYYWEYRQIRQGFAYIGDLMR